MNIRRRLAAACALALLLGACATKSLPELEPGQEPDPTTDEAGLWMYMDDVERELASSGSIVHDPALNAYVRGIVCRLAPEHCPNMRILIVQTPHFNASMAPNGLMQVWTGLILRCQNEAQLAYVLGHEFGHFLRRHTLQRWRTVRDTSDALAFFSLGTAAAGVGYAGSLAQLAALASILAYSRDQEREADDFGFRTMVAAGYDPHEAPKIWQALTEERDAGKDKDEKGDETPIFFATHPSTEERIDTLRGLADEYSASGGAKGTTGEEEFLAQTLPFRATWMRELMRIRNFDRNNVVVEHLLEGGTNPGEAHFFQGELYRLRADEGDDEKALAAYRMAVELGGVPAELHRALGQIHRRRGETAEARESFQRYLDAAPDAHDRAMIAAQIEQLQ